MRLPIAVLPVLLIATSAFAQTPATTEPAPAPAVPADDPSKPPPVTPQVPGTPGPTDAPSKLPPVEPQVPGITLEKAAPVEDPVALESFMRECWTVDGPVEGRPVLANPLEFSSYVRQKHQGALTRRAVYNTLGARQRLSDVEAQEQAFFTRHRVFQQIIPAIVGLVLVGTVPAFAAAALGGVALWFAVEQLPIDQAGNLARVLNFVALGAAIGGIPLAIGALVAAVGPLALAIWRTIQLRDAQPGFLVDGLGFSSDEAHRAADAHNSQLAVKLGLKSAPVCSDR